ncbi:hypothetical protein F5883DRAFT_430613 [Diaporthe sp. PMI_573]|nr:hypothetical protein F5883DRAFT_430613 [Diaporthaceae sp. PMI_573]
MEVAVPGLNRPVDQNDLDYSCQIYNSLPKDHEQPEIADTHIQDLATLFVRYGAHTAFGIHLIHAHFEIPQGTVLIGENHDLDGASNPRCRFAKSAYISPENFGNIHGHIFIFTKHGLRPYEYQAGPLPNLQVGNKFFVDLHDYLETNGLTGIVGLQLLDTSYPLDMVELVVFQATLMLDRSSLRDGGRIGKRTGWRFAVQNGLPRVCTPYETHRTKEDGSHSPYNKGSPHPVRSWEIAKLVLEAEGILNLPPEIVH